MGTPNDRESCGRCSFTTVVDAFTDADEDDGYDPFDGAYIEVDERDLRLASAPAVYAGRAKRWIDRTAYRLIYD